MNDTCSVKDCETKQTAGGLCQKHYRRLHRTGTVKARTKLKKCKAEGCGRSPVALGLCSMHYARLRKNGTTTLTLVGHATMCCQFGCRGKTFANRMCKRHYNEDKKGNKLCSNKACEMETYAQGMCRNHYTKQLRIRKKNA